MITSELLMDYSAFFTVCFSLRAVLERIVPFVDCEERETAEPGLFPWQQCGRVGLCLPLTAEARRTGSHEALPESGAVPPIRHCIKPNPLSSERDLSLRMNSRRPASGAADRHAIKMLYVSRFGAVRPSAIQPLIELSVCVCKPGQTNPKLDLARLLRPLARFGMFSTVKTNPTVTNVHKRTRSRSCRDAPDPCVTLISGGKSPIWRKQFTLPRHVNTYNTPVPRCYSPDEYGRSIERILRGRDRKRSTAQSPLRKATSVPVTKSYVMEGQGVTLKCKAMGDPDPTIHWRFPDGKLVHNNSRTILYDNGTLDILITTLKDSGAFNCVASNAAGIATAAVEVNMIPLPLFVNNTGHMREADPGLSDITTSTKSGSNDTKPQNKRVVVENLTANSAVIHWPSERHIPGIRMYQIQYNSTVDDTLVYRMIPSASKTFKINDLAAGREYELCVLAVYDDGITSLTATRVVGCVQFHTGAEAGQCRFIPSQFLGGTMIIIIGGIIVASVLVFIIILMIRYKTYGGADAAKAKARGDASVQVHSQTNGSRSAHSGSKQEERPESPGAKDCKALVLLKMEEMQEELKVQLPPVCSEKAAPAPQSRRSSLGGPPSDDTQTDSSLTGSTMSLCLIGSGANPAEPPRKGPLANMGLLPSELARTRHRFSFDGDYALFQSHSYPRRARTRRHKSTTQLNTDVSPPCSRRVTFSSTEWMLESTV
ncbi:leucine-rich repeat and fibronectin type III domain-containing protein 1-like [Sinocyclocheilus grahami]|uniref:leucine-rich repeat and fibronectin type III domain-containing protein 1-like n=1 Tax=Sinocyclocheilus grahami TaxID=75366 RepID=UPI0007ACBB7F|nr:PREDICTED: leucine-rich repeat and fibronectin type III domain-containing protein 1-like [Sinocyclocheilus grahami]